MEYSPKNETWIVKFAGCGHESFANMVRLFQYDNSTYWLEKRDDAKGLPLPGPPHIDSFGSAERTLADGTRKAPDHSLLDATPGRPIRLKGWPTVVFEMAWTQTSEELAWVCGRWVAASEAKVNLAIGIDVILKSEKGAGEKGAGESGKNKKGKNKQEGENERESEAKVEVEKAENENAKGNLKKRKDREEDKEIAQLWVTLWEVVKAEPLMETSEPINELLRADGKQDDPETLTDVPPPTGFTFISHFSDFPEQIAAIQRDRNMPSEPPLFVKYHVAETQRLQVCPPIITIHSI
jgi:hypothetical protein